MATKTFTGVDKPVQVVTLVSDNGDNTSSNATFLPPGRAAAASSVPVVLAIEDSPTAASRIPSAAANTNPTSAKASGGKAFRAMGNNVKASVVYLKLYDKATAPNVGTDVPVLTLPLAASTVFDRSLEGFRFVNGIAYGFTTDAADNGTTALAAGDILGFSLAYS